MMEKTQPEQKIMAIREGCVTDAKRRPRRDAVPVTQEESGRFLKKAAQKRLLIWAGGGETSTPQINRVFCYFLFTK
jgi:hypothetical protein